VRTLDATANTADRAYVLPDLAGTIALTSQLASFGAIGSTPNANGASISGGVITLQPASASFGGIMTTETQTIFGAKTFNGEFRANNSYNSIGGGGSVGSFHAAATMFWVAGSGVTSIKLANGTSGTANTDGFEMSFGGVDAGFINREAGSIDFYNNGG